MDTQLMNQVCPIHKIPLKNGKCPECEQERRASKNKKEKDNVTITVNESPSSGTRASVQCPHCHAELVDPSLKYCPHCGKLIQHAPKPHADEKKEAKHGAILKVIKQDGKEKVLELKYMTQPFGYYIKYRELEFLYSPLSSILFVQNPNQRPVYQKLIRPFPLYNAQEFRIGKLPLVLHYADTAQMKDEESVKTLMVGQDIALDTRYVIDCLECTHPNFPGTIINLNQEKIVLNRDEIMKAFQIQEEKIFTRLGVSSRAIELQRIHNIWYLFPQANPNVFIKIPGYFVPLYPEMEIIIDQIKVNLEVEL